MSGFPAKDPRRAEEGATAVDYAIMVALVAAVIVAAVSLLGSNTSDKYMCVANTFNAAPSAINC